VGWGWKRKRHENAMPQIPKLGGDMKNQGFPKSLKETLVYIRSVLCRETTKHTAMYGVRTRFWPTL
jgi:hypothetical protein